MMNTDVNHNHSTIQRWVFKYAPIIETCMHKRINKVYSTKTR